jgi:hypothetical protein
VGYTGGRRFSVEVMNVAQEPISRGTFWESFSSRIRAKFSHYQGDRNRRNLWRVGRFLSESRRSQRFGYRPLEMWRSGVSEAKERDLIRGKKPIPRGGGTKGLSTIGSGIVRPGAC